MDKPKKRTREYLDYNECAHWIEKKYNVNLRNYAGRKFTGESDDPPYQDFWHSIVNHNEIHNGSFFWFDIEWWKENKSTPDWEKEILKMFESEFGEFIDDGAIKFWVDW
jgi:hypothetical protein